MTDNEIIKALECCSGESCNGCPYSNRKCHQGNPMIRDVLDLINRQEAEIERLKKIQQRQADLIIEERGRRYELVNTVRLRIKAAISEAIREFAEKLKDVFVTIDGVFECSEIEEHIDNLVKEMVGEELC